MIDWSNERGVATEPNIDRFIGSISGLRVDTVFPDADFQNVDYLFRDKKILIELKILETEFGLTEPFLNKESELQKKLAKKFGLGPIMRGEPDVLACYAHGKREMYRAPLARIVKKANRQIRETKTALDDQTYRGLLWLVNDNFRQIDVDSVFELLCNILNGDNSHVQGLVYVTNHYVEIPGNKFANLIWVPAYADSQADDLPEFVNWLGSEWGNFCEAELGAFETRTKHDSLDLSGARPITSEK